MTSRTAVVRLFDERRARSVPTGSGHLNEEENE
jgi:hypothetical protein